MSKTSILKDSVWAVTSQTVSMVTGIVLSLFLPKFMVVEDFGYWQLFLLYASYVGLLHFGIGDGIYLRFGGLYFEKLDKEKLYPQIQLISLIQIVFAVVCVLYSYLFISDETRQFVFYAIAAFIVVENVYKPLKNCCDDNCNSDF